MGRIDRAINDAFTEKRRVYEGDLEQVDSEFNAAYNEADRFQKSCIKKEDGSYSESDDTMIRGKYKKASNLADQRSTLKRIVSVLS